MTDTIVRITEQTYRGAKVWADGSGLFFRRPEKGVVDVKCSKTSPAYKILIEQLDGKEVDYYE